MKPGSSTPAPSDVCEECRKTYSEHINASIYDWCPDRSGVVFTPAPEVADSELIAKFMGLKKHPEKDWWMVSDELAPGLTHNWSELKFDSDWRWLMSVVEKIAEYRLAYPKQTGWVCDCKIVVGRKYLYREVVNFIKWYNTQTLKS